MFFTLSNSLTLGIVQVNLVLPSLNRDFPAIATYLTITITLTNCFATLHCFKAAPIKGLKISGEKFQKSLFSQPPQPLLTIMRGFNLSHALSSPGEECNRSCSSLLHYCKLDPSEGRLDYLTLTITLTITNCFATLPCLCCVARGLTHPAYALSPLRG